MLDAATNFQSWSFLSSIPIGGHDGAGSKAITGELNSTPTGPLTLPLAFTKATPSGYVDLFVLDWTRSWQAQLGCYTLPRGNYADGGATLVSGRFGTNKDPIGVCYEGTPDGSPNLFTLNGLSTINGA